jgi:hypothetical protein
LPRKSTKTLAYFEEYANFSPRFCLERAGRRVIHVTAGAFAKVENNAGSEDWNAAPGGSICEAKTGADANF